MANNAPLGVRLKWKRRRQMSKTTLWDKIREFIGGIGWDIFIWSTRMTEAQYFYSVYREQLERFNKGQR
jgi:hypothetical protein